MSSRSKPAVAGVIYSSVLIAALAAFAPVVAQAQVKPTVTVVNPVSSPVNSRITNEVLPVTISNADPIAVQVEQASVATPLDRFLGIQATATANDISNEFTLFTASDPIELTGAMMQINSGSNSAGCLLSLSIFGPTGAFAKSLASVSAFSGRTVASPYVPLPNLVLPAGYTIRVRVSNPGAAGTCEGNVNVHMIRP